jgi:hypothetical protein
MNTIALVWIRLRRRSRGIDLGTILALLFSLACVRLFMIRPKLIELLAVLMLAVPLLLSPRLRVVFLVIGTITVFGGPELNSPKLLFLFGAMVAFAGAFMHSRALVGTPAYTDLRPLFRASFALMVVIALSLVVSHSHGVPDKEWLRDVAPYILLAVAPLFALDAQSAFSAQALRWLIAVAGFVGAVLFTLRWYGNRDIASDLSGGQFGLASIPAAGALFAFAIATALEDEKGRLRWLSLGSFVLASMATTGTRLTAVLLAAPLAIVVGSRRHVARRSLRLSLALPFAALLIVLGIHSQLKLVNADREAVSQRISLLFLSGTEEDNSYFDRQDQTRAAWALFRSDPLFGVGPGHLIRWTTSSGFRRDTPTVDTPVGFLADFGLVGLLAAGMLVIAFVSVLRRLRKRAGERTTPQLALIGFGAILLAYSLLQVPFEDKGLAVALLLLLALATRDAASRWEQRVVDRAQT